MLFDDLYYQIELLLRIKNKASFSGEANKYFIISSVRKFEGKRM